MKTTHDGIRSAYDRWGETYDLQANATETIHKGQKIRQMAEPPAWPHIDAS